MAPYGFAKTVGPDGVERGVMAAAAIIFFAFYGFDAIATAAEETKNPGRDLAIGIVGSMLLCVVIYMAVAVAAVGALPFTRSANSPEPLALILRELGQPGAAQFLAVSAVVALTAVLVAILAGLIPLDEIAALANAGTLAAFVAVSVSMLVMRVRAPDAERRFRTPAAWPVGLFAIGGCLYLFYSLPAQTQIYFGIWNLIGLGVYLAYGSRRSLASA